MKIKTWLFLIGGFIWSLHLLELSYALSPETEDPDFFAPTLAPTLHPTQTSSETPWSLIQAVINGLPPGILNPSSVQTNSQTAAPESPVDFRFPPVNPGNTGPAFYFFPVSETIDISHLIENASTPEELGWRLDEEYILSNYYTDNHFRLSGDSNIIYYDNNILISTGAIINNAMFIHLQNTPGDLAIINYTDNGIVTKISILRDQEKFENFAEAVRETPELPLHEFIVTYIEKIESGETDPLSIRTVEPTHLSADAAIDEILQNSSPQVIAFGEIHPSEEGGESTTTSLVHFSDEILPRLIAAGYHDFVIEYFLADTPQEEFDFYFDNGYISPDITPFLWDTARYAKDSDGLTYFLEKARELRNQGIDITIHGGFITSTDIDRVLLGEIEEDDVPIMIANVTQTKIEELVTQGKKVVAYNGSIHNDIEPMVSAEHDSEFHKRLLEESFGDDLRALLGENYLEIDLIVPEFLQNAPLDPLLYYLQSVPKEGVTLLQPTDGKQVIIFPQSATESETPSSEQPLSHEDRTITVVEDPANEITVKLTYIVPGALYPNGIILETEDRIYHYDTLCNRLYNGFLGERIEGEEAIEYFKQQVEEILVSNPNPELEFVFQHFLAANGYRESFPIIECRTIAMLNDVEVQIEYSIGQPNRIVVIHGNEKYSYEYKSHFGIWCFNTTTYDHTPLEPSEVSSTYQWFREVVAQALAENDEYFAHKIYDNFCNRYFPQSP
ncbi:MAG: hypothetical protein P9X27_04185 [Candidatus Kaelpia aquatica]|nr:hypothetical protein [Candidatus Kaelpia aquatica]